MIKERGEAKYYPDWKNLALEVNRKNNWIICSNFCSGTFLRQNRLNVKACNIPVFTSRAAAWSKDESRP